MHTRDAVQVTVVRNVPVPMRDGVVLRADIYGDGPLSGLAERPVLLHRTPYDKTGREQEEGWAKRFANAGYVVVMQDCRGCYESEGQVNFLFPEAEDGQDTVNWIRNQPWSSGKVATWGVSWCGWTQTSMAAVGTEGLAAMIPNMSGADGYSSSIRHGGAMELRWLAWAFTHSACNTQLELKRQPRVDKALNIRPIRFSEWLTRAPVRRGTTQLRLVPSYEDFAMELLNHTEGDGYWDSPSVNPLRHIDTFTDTPTLIVGGWYDSYTRGSFELYEALQQRKQGPIKIVMGPWVHGQDTVEQAWSGDVWFGPDAAIDFHALHMRWFDKWLRGADNGADTDPSVRIFVMGGGTGGRGPGGRLDHGGRWRHENEWPLARSEDTQLNLHPDATLARALPPEGAPPATYEFNPARPVPTIGGSISSLSDLAVPNDRNLDPLFATRDERITEIARGGGFDQRESPEVFGCEAPYLPLNSRPDVLSFETAPLDTGVEVTGPVSVHLMVSTSAADTDFTAKLLDVYPPSEAFPNGYALNLTDSITRLKYRNDSRTAQPYTPGDVVAVEIKLYPISNYFAAGHTIRLDISSSNFPRFDVNPNTGENPGDARTSATAHNAIHFDSRRPSRIVLPIIPNPERPNPI